MAPPPAKAENRPVSGLDAGAPILTGRLNDLKPGPVSFMGGGKVAGKRLARDRRVYGGTEDLEEAAKSAVKDSGELIAKKAPMGYFAWSGNSAREQGQAKEIQSRERFVETAYWNPSVITDKEGKAKLTFKAPSALSRYQLMAQGVTTAETLVGQTTAPLSVRKNFLVDIKIPFALTQGDRPRFIAQVHHLGVDGTADLKLAVYAGGHDEVYPQTVAIKGDGVTEVLFEPFEVPDTDSVRLTLTGTVGEHTDQVTTEIPLRPWGVQAEASASGKSSNGTVVFVGLPRGRTYEQPEMLISIAPSLERMIVELALGQDDSVLLASSRHTRIMPPPSGTMADRAADLLAATSALSYLKSLT